ncbi:unnamed protein product [Cuscuta campestris]|uniref:Uncharacterized protein n=1 Tax=Cuscuta campestris TaxID=132261 RepID=A0A484MYA4_9ASTE|nr:unnamed protein product [Cuscuta campestris]
MGIDGGTTPQEGLPTSPRTTAANLNHGQTDGQRLAQGDSGTAKSGIQIERKPQTCVTTDQILMGKDSYGQGCIGNEQNWLWLKWFRKIADFF